MSIPLKQSTAFSWKAGPFVDDTDGKTAETGLSIAQADIRLSKNGGDYAQSHNAAGATHDEYGEYDVPLDTTDTGTLGTLKVKIHKTGAIPVWQEFIVVTANVFDTFFSTDKLEVDVTQWGGAAIATPAIAGYPKVTRYSDLRYGTAQAGANGSVTLDASASAVTDFYKNAIIVIVSGTGANQSRTISAYAGDTKIATITPNWGTNPSSDSVFVILPMGAIAGASAPTAGEVADAVCDEAMSGHTTAGTVGKALADVLADTNELQTDLVNGGRLDLLVDAIKAKTDNLPAAPADDTSIDSQLAAIAGYLDTEIAAIKAKTDNLPAAPANEATLTTLHGHIDDILADTAELQAELADGGRTDLLIDGVKAKTDNLPSDPADQSAVEAAITAAHSTTNGKIDAVDDYVDSEVAAIKAVTDKVDTALELDGAVYRLTTNSLENSPTGSGGFTSDDRTHLESILSAVDTEIASILAAVDTEVAAILADTNELQTDLVNGGRLDLLVDAIKAKTDNLPASPAATGAAMTLTAAYNAAKTAASVSDLAAVQSDVDEIRAVVDGTFSLVSNTLEDTEELQTDLVNGGRLDLLIDAIKAKTDNLPAAPADDTSIDSQLSAIAGYLDTEIAAIKAKTDLIPATPANEATLTTIHGHIDDILVDTAELQTALTDGGRLDLLIDAIKTKTDALKASWNDLSTAQVNAEVDTALADYDAPTKAELDTAIDAIPTATENRTEMDSNSTKLANLDAAMSSRAPAATALSTAQWTNVRAALLDYLDALISTRLATAGYTAPANSDIAAVKVKTDQLIFADSKVNANADATVDEEALATAIGDALEASLPEAIDTELSATHGSGQWGAITSGPHSWTDTLVDSFGDPLEDCLVEAYSDSDYSTFVTSGKTDANGAITLYFASAGTYYFRASKAGKVSGEKSAVVA